MLIYLLIGRLLPFYIAVLGGGWVLFKIGQGSALGWLAVPVALVVAMVWRLLRWDQEFPVQEHDTDR